MAPEYLLFLGGTCVKQCPILLSLLESCWSSCGAAVSQHCTSGRGDLFVPRVPEGNDVK